MDQRIEKAVLVIAKNFRNEMLLSDLAKEIGLSKFHFHRLFKKEIGTTPLQYINKLKVEHAAHFLLLYPNSKQLEAAFESGYASPAEFARSFKRVYNLTPIQYRKKRLAEKSTPISAEASYSAMEIRFLKQQKIPIVHTTVLSEDFSKLYGALSNRLQKPAYGLGFYIDAPMHKPIAECRYFIGIENENSAKKHTHFDIEEGYYTYFDVQGDLTQLIAQILSHKKQFIDPSPYEIASVIGFEKIKLIPNTSDFDYLSAVRTFYIKISRK